jgi:membrane associated rhomboid family serine protease
VIGVLVGMVAGMAVDLMLGLMFAFVSGMTDRSVAWTANLLAMAGGMLLPLFFFMAAIKHRLLERHSQDYVGKL